MFDILAWVKSKLPWGNAAAAESEAPAKATTLMHVLLAKLEAREAGHPMIQHMLVFLDDLDSKYGEALFTDLEIAAIDFLKTRYPFLNAVMAEPAKDAPKPAA